MRATQALNGLVLTEIHHGDLMMLAYFFLPVVFKIQMTCSGPSQYVICGIYGLINVKTVLYKSTDAISI